MTSNVRVLLTALVTGALAVSSCAKDGKGASGAKAQGATGNEVVATYAGKSITAAQLDEEAADQLTELDKQRYQIRRQTLEQMIVQDLVRTEAKKQNMTEEQWLQSQIDAKVSPPSDEEVRKTFDQSSAQLPPGAKYDEFKERIADFLSRPKKQERARELFDELRKQANVDIKLREPPKPRKEVEAKGPARGPENAKVTVVEFSDFQCPYCSRAHDTVEQVMQEYAGKVRLVFRHFPLDFHHQAPKAAEASMCAHEQGKFWEYHDVLFKNQQKLEVAQLKEHATAVGLDAAKFAECLDSGKHAKTVEEDTAAGRKVGVSGTPAFFINGVMLSGAQPLEEFKRVIDEELRNNG